MFLPGKPTEDVPLRRRRCRPLRPRGGPGGWCRSRRRCSQRTRAFAASAPTFEALGEGPMAGTACRDLPTDRNSSFAKAFVDFQNDVLAKDIRLAVREGFRSIEHIKRYTTTGMATDQGKTSNINGLAIAADALQRPAPAVGLTTFRPALHADHLRRLRRLQPRQPVRGDAPHADRRLGRGQRVLCSSRSRCGAAPATSRETGEDMQRGGRPRVPGRSAPASACSTPRRSARSRSSGPDAATFMNRMYTNAWTKLEPGRCRYGLLLGEDGFIRDDGVVGRLAADRFHVTTTTGGAARVLNMMEDYLQTEWPDLDVWLTSTTEQWAVIALNGPNARKVIEPLVEGIDLAPEQASRTWRWRRAGSAGCRRGCSASASQASSASRSTSRPASAGPCGRRSTRPASAYGIVPYGTETMHVLRAEKGYIIVGQDTDGTLTPDDAGLGWAVGKTKPDFVGKRSLVRPDMLNPNRKHLVGLLTHDPEDGPRGGRPDRRRPGRPDPEEHDRARHLLLLERDARPVDRHGGDRGRQGPAGPDDPRADAGRRSRGDDRRHGRSSIPKASGWRHRSGHDPGTERARRARSSRCRTTGSSVAVAEDCARFSLRIRPDAAVPRPATHSAAPCPPGSATSPPRASGWRSASARTSGS